MARTALVIDNDENTVSQVDAALSPLGYTVSSASDAAAGLEMANNLVPSIMLVNLATPGSNGLELCKSIHGTENLTDVPIILLTLREGKFDPVYVKLYGIVSFLKKPFSDDALLELVSEHSTEGEDHAVEAEPVMEAEAFVEAEPAMEAFDEPVAAEPAMEAFDETTITEPEAEPEAFPEAFSVESFDDSDATVAMTAEDSGTEASAFEAAGELEGYDETVSLTDAESDLEDLQASFSGGAYAEEDSVTFDDTPETTDDSFDFAATAITGGVGEEEAGAQEEESSWGDVSADMTMDGGVEDSGTPADADETWGAMGGEFTMGEGLDETGGDEGFSGTDAFAEAEQGTAGGFDSEGTTAFDSGAEGGFSAGAETETFGAGGGFDSDGTMAFDSGQESGDMDIGGFKASKDASPAGGEMAGFDDGAEDSAWGDTAIESKEDTGEVAPSFDEAEEAFSDGFDDDGDEWADDLDSADVFSESEEDSFESEEAGFESDFLDDSGESAADFSGDDQDYTGLFEPEEEQEPEEEVTDKKAKKKKKKGFKKGAPSRSRRVLVLLLLLIIAGGSAYHFRDMLPFEVPEIPFEMPDIKIPFIGEDAPEDKGRKAGKPAVRKPSPAKAPEKPELKKPAPAPQAKAEAPKPAVDKPVKAEPQKAPVAKKKEPAAPKQEVVRAKKKSAPAPAEKTAAGKFIKGRYYVQFGVFGNSRNAEILSGQLNRKGFPTIKRKITNSKGKKLTVVLLDRPYKTKGSAEKRARHITDTTGFDTAVYK